MTGLSQWDMERRALERRAVKALERIAELLEALVLQQHENQK